MASLTDISGPESFNPRPRQGVEQVAAVISLVGY